MHGHLCVVWWLFSSPVSFSPLFRCSSSRPSRRPSPRSTRSSCPKTCATSAWGPWPVLTTRHPSHFVQSFLSIGLPRSIGRTKFFLQLTPHKISPESINLERKFYLDCSSDALSTRGEFGRVTYWSQTLRSWRRWTHRKSTRKDSMRKR